MALDLSALHELLVKLDLTDIPDRFRAATETHHQQLIEAETTAFIGAVPARTLRGPLQPAQRLPAKDADHHCKQSEPEDSQAAQRVLPPGPALAQILDRVSRPCRPTQRIRNRHIRRSGNFCCPGADLEVLWTRLLTAPL